MYSFSMLPIVALEEEDLVCFLYVKTTTTKSSDTLAANLDFYLYKWINKRLGSILTYTWEKRTPASNSYNKINTQKSKNKNKNKKKTIKYCFGLDLRKTR